jgi:hypothetical protein
MRQARMMTLANAVAGAFVTAVRCAVEHDVPMMIPIAVNKHGDVPLAGAGSEPWRRLLIRERHICYFAYRASLVSATVHDRGQLGCGLAVLLKHDPSVVV